MNGRLALSVALSLFLSGCSFHYEVEAVARNGRIEFEPKDDAGTGCLADFRIMRDTGEVVWELDGQYLPPPCDSKFPIAYGAVPAGMTERVRAAPLQDGVLYRIEAWDGDSYSGAFWLRPGPVVENSDERR